jgi:hypothetical protein
VVAKTPYTWLGSGITDRRQWRPMCLALRGAVAASEKTGPRIYTYGYARWLSFNFGAGADQHCQG